MAKLDLAFQLSANADGVAAGVAQADRELSKVGASAKATAAEFRAAAKITSEMRTPLEIYTDKMARLDAMLQKGLLTQEVYGRAVKKTEDELRSATSSLEEMGRQAGIAERVVNGLSTSIENIGNATKAVSEAGSAVIKFGKDIAVTYAQWKLFNAIRNPAGLKDFAIGALKGALAARTLILAAQALGVGLAIGGGGIGVAAAALLGLSNPLISGALLTYNLSRAFLDAKDRALEMAAAITTGAVSVEQLNGRLGQIQAQQVDNLAFAMEGATESAQRSDSAFAALSDVFVTPFLGAFAAITSGFSALRDGLSGIMEGLASIGNPIAQAIQPIFTLFGTVIEGILKTIGVIGELIGLVLKVAGAFLHTLLSPVIVGWTNLVETIRAGMNMAFDFIGERIDWASQKIKDFYAFMSKVPIIGRAFASGETPAEVATGAQQAAAAGDAGASAGDSLDMNLRIYEARLDNERAIADAQKKADQERLDRDLEFYQARQANEQAAADAAKKAAQEKLDQDLERYKTQRENEQAIAEAQFKRQQEIAAVDEKIAAKQADIDKVNAEKAAALNGKSNESLKANDIRSSEGMAQFIALATGREDPAIEENRKTNAKLEEIRQELRALQQEKVDILGAAA